MLAFFAEKFEKSRLQKPNKICTFQKNPKKTQQSKTTFFTALTKLTKLENPTKSQRKNILRTKSKRL